MKRGWTTKRALACACVLGANNALAQPLDEAADDAAPRWRVSLGGGLILGPKYPGADTYRLRALPVIGASYGSFFFGGDPGSGGGGIGMNFVRDPAWRLGVALTPGFGRARRESDHPSLAGMGDIDRATRASAFGGYTWRRWLGATLRVSTDIEGEDQGTLALLDLNARWRVTERVFMSAGPGVTWADKDYTSTFFGRRRTRRAAAGTWSVSASARVIASTRTGTSAPGCRYPGSSATRPTARLRATARRTAPRSLRPIVSR